MSEPKKLTPEELDKIRKHPRGSWGPLLLDHIAALEAEHDRLRELVTQLREDNPTWASLQDERDRQRDALRGIKQIALSHSGSDWDNIYDYAKQALAAKETRIEWDGNSCPEWDEQNSKP